MFSIFYELFKEYLKTLELTELIRGNEPKISNTKERENQFVALARHLRNSVAHGNFSIKGRTMFFEDFSAKKRRFVGQLTLQIYKSSQGLQNVVFLIGKVRNIFSVAVGRYTKSAQEQRGAFKKAQTIWEEAAQGILCA